MNICALTTDHYMRNRWKSEITQRLCSFSVFQLTTSLFRPSPIALIGVVSRHRKQRGRCVHVILGVQVVKS